MFPSGRRNRKLSFFKTNNVAKFKATHSTLVPGNFNLNIIRSSSINEGIGIVIEVIFLAVGLYVAAFILPGALTAIATTALTSVNGGTVTLFQTLVPLIAIVVIILLFIGMIRKTLA
jgi:hypothetical protein